MGDLKRAGFCCESLGANERLNKRIRNAQVAQFNYILVVGDSELDSETVNVRMRDGNVLGEMPIATFLDKIAEERDNFQ